MLNSFNPVLQVKYIDRYYKTNCFKEEAAVEYREVCEFIMNIKGPFNTTDLFLLLKDVDRKTILNALDEVYEAGVLDYREVKEDTWGYFVKK